MYKYEKLNVVGKGSYGIVTKCKDRETGQIVAIKKFYESEEDVQMRQIALREIRILKRLHHENLVHMIEVFRKRKHFYLVFEYIDHNLLNELESNPFGLGEQVAKEYTRQVVSGIEFCHRHDVIHRDIKPENILVTFDSVLKLCDFGFARPLSPFGETCTDYVATRWYRAPELLVGDTRYGSEVDIWATGCVFAEMMSGQPLLAGESDIDQLYRSVQLLGPMCPRHHNMIAQNPDMTEMPAHTDNPYLTLRQIYPEWSRDATTFLLSCVMMNPNQRPTALQLLHCDFLRRHNVLTKFLPHLQQKGVVRAPLYDEPVNEKLPPIKSGNVQSTQMFSCSTGKKHLETPKWHIQFLDKEQNHE